MINVLDKGFVRLVDSMGDDSAIVQAARVSYGAGTKTIREDEKLIGYLIRNKHSSPLEMVTIKLHLKMPIFVARQMVRHRTSSMNEVSARYTEVKEEYYTPESWRKQDTKNKQGSTDGFVDQKADDLYNSSCSAAFETYHMLLESGVAREMARMVLPLSMYTEFYWQQNLHNLLHLLKLRLDPHAQWEFQQYAKAILEIITPIVPITVQTWKETL